MADHQSLIVTFTWLNSQAVRSDSGFEVESMGRFSIEYREGEKVVDVYVERGLHGGRPCVIVSADSFKRWTNGPSGEAISPARQQVMLDNFIAALEFQDLAVVVG